MLERDSTQQILGAAIEVPRALGPGLLESAYEACLCHELSVAGIAHQQQATLPVRYKETLINFGCRALCALRGERSLGSVCPT